MTSTVALISDAESLGAAVGPLRRRLLAALTEPASAAGLARLLGLSRQRVNYHLRALEDAGLVELVEERQRRGAVERLVRRTADVLVVDPTALDPDVASRDTAGAAGVIAGAADAIRGVSAAAAEADVSGRRLAAVAMDATVRLRSPAALRRLEADLATVIAAHDTGRDGDGLTLRITTLIWPPQEAT